MQSDAQPVPGPCSISTEDRTELSAPSDVRLAWEWAAHEHGDAWAALSYGERCSEASAAHSVSSVEPRPRRSHEGRG